MFGTSATTSELAADQLESLNHASEAIGLPKPRWRKDSAEFVIKGEKYPVPISSLRTFIQRADVRSSPTVAALSLAELLTITPPLDLLHDLKPIHHLLRPKLLHPRELQGPRRSMCRRDVLDHLIQAIAVGRSELAPLVTSSILDRWGLTFEELLSVSLENLRHVLTADHLHDVDGAPGVLALLHRHEQAAAGAFILESLFLDSTTPDGVIFSTPREDLLLALPVVANAGADGLAAFVQATFAMAHERGNLLSEHIFWSRDGEAVYLPMTTIEEDTSRRVHVEAKGPLEELLRILGAIE